jgi:uncharacterized repeat protein (TIGR03843 family)
VRSEQQTLHLLRQGEISCLELTPWGSNYTFEVKVGSDSGECKAIYKPRRGEAPLWDFPDGTLFKREYAAYLFSQVLGWKFIPLTIIRDGPHGIGTLQLYVDHDPKISYFNIRESNPDALKMIACFDLAANNADRKAVHFLQAPGEKIWGIDHGLTFHSALKVRTVVWDFGGEPIPNHLLKALSSFLEKLKTPRGRVRELVSLLSKEEVIALVQRITWLLETQEYPGLARRRRR